jgi:arsenate reductase-like glutaredoxin family protein
MKQSEVDTILAEVEAAVEDARADYPDVNDDDLYHAMMDSILTQKPDVVRREVRMRLGFDYEGME